MITVWNPPLFSAGSFVVRNTYKTIEHGKKWEFFLEVLWEGQVLELDGKEINRTKTDKASTEHLTIIPVEGGYSVAYKGHLVSADDVTEIEWAATLTQYLEETPTMPYLGMWQVHETINTRTSTAEERNKRQMARQAVKESVMAFVSVVLFLFLVGGICYICFIH